MTFWDRLILEYPDMAKHSPVEIRVKCPSNWGYEKMQKGHCRSMKTCEECWNREMKEEK